jgi:hypothetical protein
MYTSKVFLLEKNSFFQILSEDDPYFFVYPKNSRGMIIFQGK